MSTVYLHVGALKTGTTHLQRVLVRNRAVLAERGVLFPGRNWRDQVEAVEEVVGRRPKGKPETTGAWDRLTHEICAHDGPVVVSMETFSSASDEVASRVVADLAPRRVRVVVTARDVGRVIPAQWQEWVQNGGTHSYERYLRAVTMKGSRRVPVVKSLWWNLDLSRILRTWQPHVDPEDLVLVTVPPSGSDRSLLWRRFCQAIEMDPVGFDLDVPSNESLGAVSAELMRRINVEAKERDLGWQARNRLKQRLGRRVLAARKANEPSLAFPERHREFAMKTGERLVREVSEVGPVVVGELSDLLPVWGPRSPDTVEAPESLSAEVLLQAAVEGLVGLSSIEREGGAGHPGAAPAGREGRRS